MTLAVIITISFAVLFFVAVRRIRRWIRRINDKCLDS